ncbi:MAG: DMT family transporter [Candidatus Marinimicrobia bacterium]|nr:DMT family transporter [Candidatus Neomarinimicrobiota bacterium]
MDKKELKTDIMLVVAAILWGLGFVAQRDGMNYIGPFFYTAIRFGIGVLCLIPIYFMTRKQERKIKVKKKTILISGLIVGIFLFLGVNSQQIGLVTTTAGKASFITAFYMILVPVFGLILGHKTKRTIWIAIVIALLGLYFMSINQSFQIETGDIYMIACAIFWAIHFLFISHYSSRVGAIRLSILQFFVCAVLSLIVAIIKEPIDINALPPALPSLLYGGIGAVGIAYTLHVIALKDANPAYASLILSTESVFGAVGGWLILHETMTSRQILGAVLIMAAVILTQIKKSKKALHKNTIQNT